MSDQPNETALVEAPTPPQMQRSSRSGCLGAGAVLSTCLIALMTMIALPILAILFLVLTGVSSLSGAIEDVFGGIGDIFNPEPSTANVVSSPTILTSIQPLGQLVSISVQLAKADVRVSVREGFQNSCGYSANHVIQGAVEAGFDLTSLREEDVSYDASTNTYTVYLPAPQLTSCRIDFIDQYDASTTLCSVNWDSARQLAQYEGLQEFRDDALEGGILQRAEQEAQLTITNFLRLATGQQVNVVFKQADPNLPPTYPPSCSPQPPAGWSFDAVSDSWSN